MKPIVTSSSSANLTVFFESAGVNTLPVWIPPSLPGEYANVIAPAIRRLQEAGEKYVKAVNEETLTEGDYADAAWCGKMARNSVLDIIDKEVSQSGDQKVIDNLQQMYDDLNTYVRNYLKLDYEEEQAEDAAQQTYQDQGLAVQNESGELENVAEAAPLNAAARRKHATVVRTKKNGAKEYKFPIPDKAHARAALRMIDQSDLTPAEKAKVKKRAYRVLGKTPSTTTTESNVPDDEFTALGEAVDATIGGSMDDLQLVTIGEATEFDLEKGELVVTFIKPGLNSSGKRYYPKETIATGITEGLFTGLKMFVNHASLQELSQRPERSLTEWVSTVKESWVDPATGNGKAKIKVVQTWFKNFLKDLQEAGALPDIGLSIFATGRVKPGTIQGKSTSIVEKFQSAMSIDWVTEPGAGGRVDAIWESHQPMMIKEQELNMLNSMKLEDALKEIRESRPDILEAVRGEFAATQQTEAEKAAEAAAKKAQDDRITALEAELKESKDSSAAEKAARVKAEYQNMVQEALKEAKLPDLAKSRIAQFLAEPVLKEDGEVDETKVKESVSTAVKAEEEYMAALIKSQSKGTGITGLGESAGAAPTDAAGQKSAHDRVTADVARRLGLGPETTTTTTANGSTATV